MIDLTNIYIPTWLGEFTQSEFFKHFGVIITFLYSFTPSFIPIPTEYFMYVLLSFRPVPEQLEFGLFLVAITTLGGFIADLLIYKGASHIHRLVKRWKKMELKESSKFHKYGIPLFLVSPVSSVVFIGFNEGLLIYAGHHHVKLSRIFPYLVTGEIIRGIVGGMILFKFMNLL